jgi:hypothetical protein
MSPELTAVADVAGEIFCDRAETILRDALESENEARRDVASRFVLSGKGAMRGWTRPLGSAVTVEGPSLIAIKWLDGAGVADMEIEADCGPALIDARPADGDEPSSE